MISNGFGTLPSTYSQVGGLKNRGINRLREKLVPFGTDHVFSERKKGPGSIYSIALTKACSRRATRAADAGR